MKQIIEKSKDVINSESNAASTLKPKIAEYSMEKLKLNIFLNGILGAFDLCAIMPRLHLNRMNRMCQIFHVKI